MYAAKDDWEGDINRHDIGVHYRLYYSRSYGFSVICVQAHDYPDYDARLILSPAGWYSETEAEKALLKLLPIAKKVTDSIEGSDVLNTDLRHRLIAMGIRNELELSSEGEK